MRTSPKARIPLAATLVVAGLAPIAFLNISARANPCEVTPQDVTGLDLATKQKLAAEVNGLLEKVAGGKLDVQNSFSVAYSRSAKKLPEAAAFCELTLRALICLTSRSDETSRQIARDMMGVVRNTCKGSGPSVPKCSPCENKCAHQNLQTCECSLEVCPANHVRPLLARWPNAETRGDKCECIDRCLLHRIRNKAAVESCYHECDRRWAEAKASPQYESNSGYRGGVDKEHGGCVAGCAGEEHAAQADGCYL